MDAIFATEVTPKDTVISLEDTGAIDLFPSSGTAYIIGSSGKMIDLFEYTAKAGTTFTGVTLLNLYHPAGTECRPSFGFALQNLLAPVEQIPEFDEDGFTSILMEILDVGYTKLKEIILHLRRLKNPMYVHEAGLEDLVKGLGVEYGPDQDEAYRRLLAMTASPLLREKGSADAFVHIAYLVCGYHTTVKLINYLVPFQLNTSYGVLLHAPQQFEEEPFTKGLYAIADSPAATLVNDISGGPDMTISDVAMWTTGAGVSMFTKDQRIDFLNNLHTAYIPGDSHTTLYLNSRKTFSFEIWYRPVAGGLYPQTLVTKAGVFSIVRHAVDGITVMVTDGVTTRTITADSVLTLDRSEYIAVRFDENDFSLIVNGIVVENQCRPTFSLRDIGSVWGFGGTYGANPLIGGIDGLRITLGRKYETEFLSYYEHIRVLRTIGTEDDETTYTYDEASQDGCLYVEVVNDDGDVAKHEILTYLAHEWLGAGCNQIHFVGHLPFEATFGWF